MAVGIAIRGVRLPQFDDGLRTYTQAVAFFLVPLIALPALSSTLAAVDPYEKHSSRSQIVQRVGLAVGGSLVIFCAVLPSALLGPTQDAIQVLVENLLAMVGIQTLAGFLLRPHMAWLPVYALTMLGVTGPESGWVPTLALINRTTGDTGLLVSTAVFLLGVAHYAGKGCRSL